MRHSSKHPFIRVCHPGRALVVSGLLNLCSLALSSCHKSDEPVKSVSAEVPAEMKSDEASVTIPPGAPQQSSLAVEAAKPLSKATVKVTGRLAWDEETTVRVFSSVAGRVSQVKANIGQQVSTGDTLALMASVDFGQAQADASKADADLKLSEHTLTRLNDLLEHGAAAKKDVEAAEDDLENKKAEKARAQARLKLYGVESGSVDGMFPLKAPITGLIVEKSINAGQEVRSDMMLASVARLVLPLFVISSPARLTVVLDVTELETSNLNAGQEIEISSRAYPDKTFKGRLELIGGSIDPMTRTVKARGYVENPDGLLKAEMYVSVNIATKAAASAPAVVNAPETDISGSLAAHMPSSVEVSSNAVFLKDNRHFVFIEKEPGRYERKSVEVGTEADGRVCVTNGLAPGQRVVTQGCLLLEAVTEGAKD
ncbi:MAG: Efflux transporter, family, subunit [Verrucomicrobiaceae bacterium]|nr:Efflux transporter, family, subunit [Verrucomicrobiaceae bacterium]